MRDEKIVLILLSCIQLSSLMAVGLTSGSDVRKALSDLKDKHNDSTSLHSNMSMSDAKDLVKKWNRDFNWGNVDLHQITNNSSFHYKLVGPSGFDDVIIEKGKTVSLKNAHLSTGSYTLKPYRTIATTMFGSQSLVDPITSDETTAQEYALAGGDITITPAGFDTKKGLLVAQTEKYDNEAAGVTIPARTHAIMVDMFVGGTPSVINIALEDLAITNNGQTQTIARVMPRISQVLINGINLFTAVVTKNKHVGDAADGVTNKLNVANVALEHSHFSSAVVSVGQDASMNADQNSVSSLVAGQDGWLWSDVPAQSATQYKIGKDGALINYKTDFSKYVTQIKVGGTGFVKVNGSQIG